MYHLANLLAPAQVGLDNIDATPPGPPHGDADVPVARPGDVAVEADDSVCKKKLFFTITIFHSSGNFTRTTSNAQFLTSCANHVK